MDLFYTSPKKVCLPTDFDTTENGFGNHFLSLFLKFRCMSCGQGINAKGREACREKEVSNIVQYS